MTSASSSGSRWAPGAASTTAAPWHSGQNSSHTDTSNPVGVFCSTRSAGAERPPVLHPRQAVDDRPVGDRHALGPAGRARREQHVGRVVRARPAGAGPAGRGRPARAAASVVGGRAITAAPASSTMTAAALGGQVGVERDVGGARPAARRPAPPSARPTGRGRRRRPTRARRPGPPARRRARVGPGQSSSRVGEALGAEDDGDRVGRRGRLARRCGRPACPTGRPAWAVALNRSTTCARSSGASTSTADDRRRRDRAVTWSSRRDEPRGQAPRPWPGRTGRRRTRRPGRGGCRPSRRTSG